MKVFGFKAKRLVEWAAVGKADVSEIPLRDIARLAVAMMKSVVKPHVDRITWARRMRKCHRCVFFEHDLKRCHLVDLQSGTVYGCSCYMPFKALCSGSGWATEHVDSDASFCW